MSHDSLFFEYIYICCVQLHIHNWHCWWMKSCTSWLSHDSPFYLNTSIYFVFNCIFIIDTVDGWNPAPVDCHMTLFFLNTSIYFVFNWIFHNWHCWWMKSCTSWLSHDSLFFEYIYIFCVQLYIHNWHCWWMKSCTSWLSHDFFFWIHLYILCSTVYSIIDTVDGWNPAPVDCHMTLFFLNTSIYVVFNCIFHNWHCSWMKSCTSWLSHDSFFLNTSIYVVFKLYIP